MDVVYTDMDVVYTDMCRYEIQEQKEVAVWCTGIYWPVSSTGAIGSLLNLQPETDHPDYGYTTFPSTSATG
jgi:hypothetical protein